jgi:hypothetical protein
MNLHGRYEGGGMIVTAKRWWSPKDRRAARLAAAVLAHEAPKFRPGSVLYYEGAHYKPTWKP